MREAGRRSRDLAGRTVAWTTLVLSAGCAAAAGYLLLRSVDFGSPERFRVALEIDGPSATEIASILRNTPNEPPIGVGGDEPLRWELIDRLAREEKDEELRYFDRDIAVAYGPELPPAALGASPDSFLEKLMRAENPFDQEAAGGPEVVDAQAPVTAPGPRRRPVTHDAVDADNIDPLEIAIDAQAGPARAMLEGYAVMEVGEPSPIRLAIERGSGEEMTEMAKVTSAPTLRDSMIRITADAAATVESPLLEITPAQPEWRSLRRGVETVWTWTALPKREGKDILTLTLLQKVEVGPQLKTVPVENYPQEIEVTVSSWGIISRFTNGVRAGLGNLTETLASATALLTSIAALVTSARVLRNAKPAPAGAPTLDSSRRKRSTAGKARP